MTHLPSLPYSGRAGTLIASIVRRGAIIVPTALICCFMHAPARADIPPEQKSRVLVLDSYHPYYTWSDNEVSGIVETLQKARPDSEPIVEYLDCKYFPKQDHFDHLRDLFVHKFKNMKIPLIMAVDNPALDFALKYRDEIFPGTPIIFCGINGFEPEMIAGQKNVTGVAELLDVRGTVEMMLQIHPGAREIFIIHDYTSTGLATRRQAEKDLKGLTGRVSIRYMDNVATSEMLRQIKSLPQTSLVFVLSYSRDSEGRVYDQARIAHLLGEQSPVPVYGGHEERIGHGIIGGSLLGGRLHGAKAAEMAVEVLGGRDIATMPVYTGKTTRTMFDYKLLTRFNIPLDRLPYNTILINRPESFYAKYTTLVWGAMGILTSLGIIITLLAMNVAQKRRWARELAAKAGELERSNAELQEFSMIAYHDLQEPLRIIGGFVQLLERRYRGRLDHDADEYIAITVQNVNHMKQLFSDLLGYLQLNKQERVCAAHDGNDILKSVLSGLKGEIDACGAEVTFDPLPAVFGDRSMLTLIMHNLLSNAIKFRSGSPRIHVSWRREGGQLVISVHDNGIGIAPEFHGKIFQIFRKLHNRSEYPGTGIGLATCKRAVELHNGHVWFESEPDHGSTFFFSLPDKGPGR
jgi:signal transduction histidine kinase